MQLKDFLPQFTPWAELREAQRSFFVGDEYLPLPEMHAERIKVLFGANAASFNTLALQQIPDYSRHIQHEFKYEQTCLTHELWNEQGVAQVREWLFKTGVPFSTLVYLLYDAPRVVSTEWKILVRYWDAFAWSVGMAMVVVDDTISWFCEFHHEDVITFKRY